MCSAEKFSDPEKALLRELIAVEGHMLQRRLTDLRMIEIGPGMNAELVADDKRDIMRQLAALDILFRKLC